MPEPKRRSRGLFSLLLLLGVLAGVVWVLFNRQYLVDTVVASQYKPSAEMETIRDSLGLTDEGKRLFAASQPIIEDASTFNENCKQQSETNNPILGCYASQRIYVYRVTNPELRGIEETTTAHELLHAVYERLGASEKAAVDAALQDAYQSVKTPELEQRMNYYRESEPGQENNELHSILATEQMALPNVLEEHYARYFSSRQKVVDFFQQYNSVFLSATAKLKQLQDEINADATALNERINSYNAKVKQLEADTSEFNRRSTSGEFDSQAAFSSERSQLVARQTALDQERSGIEQAISASAQRRTEYNNLVEKYNQLSRSINSSLAPAPSL